jgi:hypothetical protein
MIPSLGLYDFSSTESEKIVRLPLFFKLIDEDIKNISIAIYKYYNF